MIKGFEVLPTQQHEVDWVLGLEQGGESTKYRVEKEENKSTEEGDMNF